GGGGGGAAHRGAGHLGAGEGVDEGGFAGAGRAEQADHGVLGGEGAATVETVQERARLVDRGLGGNAVERLDRAVQGVDPVHEGGGAGAGSAQQGAHPSSRIVRASPVSAAASAVRSAPASSSPSSSSSSSKGAERSAIRASSRLVRRSRAVRAMRRTASSPKIVSSSFWPTTAVAAPAPTSSPVGMKAVEVKTTTMRATPTAFTPRERTRAFVRRSAPS